MTNVINTSRRSLIWTLRIAALALVCLGVGGTAFHAITKLSEHQWTLRPAWLLLSGAVYAVGMAPMGWFWHRTLNAFGYAPPLSATMRAYYFGQLGKYVPGKAMVIVLRVAAMRRWAPSMRLVIVSVFVETLTVMAVGALLAATMSALVLKSEAYIPLLAFGIFLVTCVPTLPPALKWFVRLGAGRFAQGDVDESQTETSDDAPSRIRGITFGVLGTGWIASVICWMFFATSLWAILRAIGIDGFSLIANLPMLITAVASAVVLGFVSMIPGGLGVRDGVLFGLLAPVCGEANALVVAVLMRLVWLVSEVLACGILYIARRSQKSDQNSN